MFAYVKRRTILLLAGGVAVVGTPLMELIAPAPYNADTAQRLGLGLRAFCALTVIFYFLLLSEMHPLATQVHNDEFPQLSLGRMLWLALFMTRGIVFLPAGLSFIMGDSWFDIARALLLTFVALFNVFFLIIYAFRRLARRRHALREGGESSLP